MKNLKYIENLLVGKPVQWKTLGEVVKIETGKLNANQGKVDGKYMFFTCDELPKKIDVYTHDTEAVFISGNGSRLGHVTYFKGKFNAYQRTYILSEFSNEIIVRYLYFVLLNKFRVRLNIWGLGKKLLQSVQEKLGICYSSEVSPKELYFSVERLCICISISIYEVV